MIELYTHTFRDTQIARKRAFTFDVHDWIDTHLETHREWEKELLDIYTFRDIQIARKGVIGYIHI